MPEWVDIPIGTKSYLPRSGTQSVERLVNLYAEPSEDGGKKAVALYGDPGLVLWNTAGDGPIRGMLTAPDGSIYVVSGTSLYRYPPVGAGVLIGTIDGTHMCRMVHNGTHLLVAADHGLYYATATELFDHTATLSSICGLAYQDGYGILMQAGSQRVYVTAVDDFSSIDLLDFTALDRNPDLNITCTNSQGELWGFKERTIEVLANTGAATFPFTRVAFIERGCGAAGSVALGDGSVFWLGNDKRVYRSNGYQPIPISTPAIDRMIAGATGHASAEAFVYTLGGHTHYTISFGDLAISYNLTTRTWRERVSYGLTRWRAQGYALRSDGITNLVGDYDSGNIYELDIDTYTENSEILARTIVCPPLSADPNPISVHGLALDFEAGVGLTSGQGSDPVVLLSWSDDDGRTWSNDVSGSLGALGNYRWRAQFNRLGRSRNRSFRFRISDPVKVAILGVKARLEALAQ